MPTLKSRTISQIGCILSLVILITLSFLFSLYWRDFESPFNIIIPVMLATFVAVSPLILLKARTAWLEIRALSNVNQLDRFQDGQIVSVSGKIKPQHSIVLSPFTKNKCLAYYYKAYYVVHNHGEDESDDYYTDYTGFIMCPSFIEIDDIRKVNLLGFPERLGFKTMNTHYHDKRGDLYLNAEAYFKSRQYQIHSFNPSVTAVHDREGVGVINENDWVVVEKRTSKIQSNIKKLRLAEEIIPPNVEVTVLGTWSQEKQGLINANLPDGKILITRGNVRSTRMRLITRMVMNTLLAISLAVIPSIVVFVFGSASS